MKRTTALVGLGLAGLAALYLSEQTAAADTGSSLWDPFMSTTRLSASEIARYAAAAGFEGDDLITAVAIALAESGGNPSAYNPETAAGAPLGQGSFGLWQIYLHMHPEYQGQNLFDPALNASAAYAIYRAARGFRPWATFTGGNYLAQLDQAAQGVQTA